jgi:hypothetical protein
VSAGFDVLPRRGAVARAFAWLGRFRRLSKDYKGATGDRGSRDAPRDEQPHAGALSPMTPFQTRSTVWFTAWGEASR